MTRHNLAVHISWLLSSEVSLLADGHIAPAASTTNASAVTEISYAHSKEDDTEDSMLSPLPSPNPNCRIARTVNVAPDFQQPPLPYKITPQQISLADESMGRLSSASKSARPGLVSQHQLATPASTVGSISSLTQGYSAWLRAKNGKS